MDLRASPLERCQEAAKCAPFFGCEITSKSAVEDAANVSLERRTQRRVEHELRERGEAAARVRVGDVVDPTEHLVDDRGLRDVGLDDLRSQGCIERLELGAYTRKVVRNIRGLRKHIAHTLKRPIGIHGDLVA